VLAKRRRAADREQALALAELARWELTASAVGAAVAWAAGAGVRSPQWRAWTNEAAAATGSRAAFPRPRDAAIDGLAGRRDGSRVTVTGRVTSVDIAHRRGKAISTVVLDDGTGAVDCVLSYIKVDSGGLKVDGAARLTGSWARVVPDTGGPGILLDRLAQSDARSFPQRARLAIAPEASPWPHQLNAAWTLEPGREGAANLLRYGTWYASGRANEL
jgi:hypothetical protein